MKKSSYREPDPFPSNLVALLERIVCVKYFGLFCFLMKREFKGTLKIISKRLLLLQLAIKSGTKHNNILMAICKLSVIFQKAFLYFYQDLNMRNPDG